MTTTVTMRFEELLDACIAAKHRIHPTMLTYQTEEDKFLAARAAVVAQYKLVEKYAGKYADYMADLEREGQ